MLSEVSPQNVEYEEIRQKLKKNKRFWFKSVNGNNYAYTTKSNEIDTHLLYALLSKLNFKPHYNRKDSKSFYHIVWVHNVHNIMILEYIE